MKIAKMRTNHLENPIGYLMETVSLSWIVEEAEGSRMESARVEVAGEPSFETLLFDSGRTKEADSLDYPLPLAFDPGKRYYWRVSVWDNEGGSAQSDSAYFETAMPMEKAGWITSPYGGSVHPLMKKSFSLHGEVESARLAICGLGVYEAYLNGEKVGEEYLAPFNNDYNLWLQYQTYDVTEQLYTGENVLGVMLGNGWYKGRFGYVDKMDKLYGDDFALICELRLTYTDGRTETIASDESFLCCPSPVMESSIYDGEFWDARKEIPDWAQVGCQADFVPAMAVKEPPEGKLTARLSVPVEITQRRKPAELIYTPAGELVVDFGQNMTGWVEFVCEEPEGTEICLQFGEILQNGNFYNDNLRTAKEEYHYISNGKKALVRPHFTFYGFRYMKVTGMSEVKPEDFTGCVIHSRMDRIGTITTSNSKVNRLFLNALWGQRGNFLDTPTDCPQRDERMGWTGDAQAFCQTASYNMYTPAFYRKYLYDMRLEQNLLGGAVPHVVPDVLGQIHWLREEKGKKTRNNAVNTANSSCAWADAATIIPWKVYLTYGDKTLLREQYGNMKAWTDRIHTIDVERCGGKYLWTDGFHYADWLALDNYQKGCYGATDPYFVASVYYYYSSSLTAGAAKALGLEEDAAYYGEMASRVKEAIQEEYFTRTGRLAFQTQTAMVLALQFDLVPEEFRERLTRELERRLHMDKNHLTTGFVGTQYLCPVLADNGMEKLAYTLLLNEDYPSWLYEVNMGATTVWERWNSVLENGMISDTGMNSLNHYAYGSIVEWMYRYMCGVSACEEAPGFARFTVKPYVDERFDWVSMEYESSKGLIRSAWKKTESGYTFTVEVPFDAEADFVLTMEAKKVRVNGQEQEHCAKGNRYAMMKGIYEIEVEL